MPDRMPLRDVVLLFAASFPKGVHITKLVKLAYLADVEHQRRYGRPLSDAVWKFNNYGPFTDDFFSVTDALVAAGLARERPRPVGSRERIFIPTHLALDEPVDVSPQADRVLSQVYADCQGLTVAEIKDVAYATPTMKNAHRGEALDLSREPQPYEFRHPDLDAFLASAPRPYIRSYGDPAASAAEDLAIMREMAPLRREANRTIDD